MDMEFVGRLGGVMQKADGGECVIELEVRPDHYSMASRVHGGVLFTLLDTAMGRAVITSLPEGKGCATIEAKINYFRPMQEGTMRAVGRVLRMTRRTAYAEGILTDDQGNELARSSGTFFLTDTIHQSDRERV